jgi:hypothetical protein
LGTSLEQLEELNGRPFQIEPGGSDVAGNIPSWQEGKLAETFGQGENGKVLLTVGWQEPSDGPTAKQRALEDMLSRQTTNSFSNNQHLRQLHPTVTRLRLVFP